MKKLLTLFLWSAKAQINENCESLEVGQQCENDCVDVFAKCAIECKTESTCIVDCNRELARCSSDCPCHSNCQNGCPCDFASDYCDNECKMEPVNQVEYKKCADKATIELLTCDHGCEAFDDNCLTKCAGEFNTAISNCPCMTNCANGCPCETYQCEQSPTVEPPPPVINNDVHLLVLDGKNQMNKFSMTFRPPMVFDNLNQLENFQLDAEFDSVASTCNVVFKGQMQVATGGNVKFFRMTSENTLAKVPFIGKISTGYPLCSMMTEDTMVMCETDPNPYDDMHYCNMLSLTDNAVNYDVSFPGTPYSHQLGSMNLHNGEVFMFAGRHGVDDNQLNSKGFTLRSDKWAQIVDGSTVLPNGIAGHSSVSFNNELLIFGGYWINDTPSNIAFRVVDGQLEFYGSSLLSSRSMHRTVVQGNSLIHIGGASKRNSSTVEVWQWNGDNFDIFNSHSLLTVGATYVEAVTIDAEDYEDEITKEDFDITLFVQSPASSDANHNNSPRFGLTSQFSVSDTGLRENYLIEDVVPNALAEIDYMCGYRVKNRFFLAGSKKYELSAQRWELTTTGWTRRPNLPFDFDEGRCIEFDEDRALLCSAYLKGKKCALVDHTDWGYTNIADTQHDHYGGELVNYNGTKMIISSTQSRWVELLNKDNLTWRPINEVPAKFKRFSAVNLNTFVYIFGKIHSS